VMTQTLPLIGSTSLDPEHRTHRNWCVPPHQIGWPQARRIAAGDLIKGGALALRSTRLACRTGETANPAEGTNPLVLIPDLTPAMQRLGVALVLAAFAAPGAPAHAQGKLDARYAATLAGIPIGEGTWSIDIGTDQYTGTASGHVGGLMRVLATGEGTTAARGI